MYCILIHVVHMYVGFFERPLCDLSNYLLVLLSFGEVLSKFLFSFAALSRKHEVAEHGHSDVTKLRETCPTSCVPRHPRTRNWSQLWIPGKAYFW